MFTLERSIKVRFVFDLFSKGYDGLLFNNYFKKGFNFINSFFDVLVVWRWNEVVFIGDIRKMFN